MLELCVEKPHSIILVILLCLHSRRLHSSTISIHIVIYLLPTFGVVVKGNPLQLNVFFYQTRLTVVWSQHIPRRSSKNQLCCSIHFAWFYFPRERLGIVNWILYRIFTTPNRPSLILVKPSAVFQFRIFKELSAMKIPLQHANCAVNHLAGCFLLIAPNLFASKHHSK